MNAAVLKDSCPFHITLFSFQIKDICHNFHAVIQPTPYSVLCDPINKEKLELKL